MSKSLPFIFSAADLAKDIHFGESVLIKGSSLFRIAGPDDDSIRLVFKMRDKTFLRQYLR